MQTDAKLLTIATGNQFVKMLVAKQFSDARACLTQKMQQEYSLEQLATQYEKMIAYGNGPIQVDGYFTFMDDWPTRLPQDLGWIYISISGADFIEAVTVIVTHENGSPRIRTIEWGRP